MRVYKQMLDKESSEKSKKTPKFGGKGSKGKGRPKSVIVVDDSDKSDKNSDNELEQLKEENQRLKELVEKYKNDSHLIINKASDLKKKDKTSVMQIVELLKLNDYLISHLPDSERILDDYLVKRPGSAVLNGKSVANRVVSTANTFSKAFKSPVINPVSNNLKNSNKNGSEKGDISSSRKSGPTSCQSDSDSDHKSVRSSKCTKIKPKPDESDGRKKDKIETTPRRVSPRKPPKRSLNRGSDSESRPIDQNESTVSKRSNSSNRTASKTRKEDNEKKKDSNEKPKPKRKRRPRVEEHKGLFPCTFDPRQCDEIMDTKEHYDFHMSGHYDAKYVCPHCAYTGPTIQIIKRHINKERETAMEDAKKGKPLNADKRAHKESKVYQCFGCKVCDKIHDKLEKRCEHIIEDDDNQCDFMHDMDYEFKDHLKRHFVDKFKNIKDKDERKQKIRTIVDKFVDELYFENNAKKGLLIEKFNKTMEEKKRSEDEYTEQQKNKSEDKEKEKKKTDDKSEKSGNVSSDSDWD